jgi:hypothetical protein
MRAGLNTVYRIIHRVHHRLQPCNPRFIAYRDRSCANIRCCAAVIMRILAHSETYSLAGQRLHYATTVFKKGSDRRDRQAVRPHTEDRREFKLDVKILSSEGITDLRHEEAVCQAKLVSNAIFTRTVLKDAIEGGKLSPDEVLAKWVGENTLSRRLHTKIYNCLYDERQVLIGLDCGEGQS